MTLLKILTFSLLFIALSAHAYRHNVGIIPYCERQFELNRFSPQTPYTQKMCGLVFEKMTYEWETGKYSNQ